ncbi:MAG: TIGR02710 family CRISPR-associated protein [Acidobacteria bacterium]|nr:TIGR02710 family CRISPR-associated protein [Acidobacteriota bacterium]
MPSTLLISVGGTPGPIIFSIRQHGAERVLFFTSPGSRRLVTDEILPALLQDPGRLPDHEFIVTEDEQDLGETVFTLLREVPRALRRLGERELEWPDLVDYTAGTKTMSAALILASSRYPCRVAYIGTPDSSGRTKEGLGVVIEGKERMFRQENPWNRIAWLEARDAVELFNRGQYGNAAGLLRHIRSRVDDEYSKRLYIVLGEIFEAFYQWDIFNHRGAKNLLFKNLQPLCDLAQTPHWITPTLKPFADEVQELAQTLKGIEPGEITWEAIHDLLANALRRAELEQKYEDAVARCYAAIEKTAQRQLSQHGISTSDVRLERIPGKLRAEYERRYTQIEETPDGMARKVRIGAIQALELLAELQDPVGRRYREIQKQLTGHLADRNRSILAHGFVPMREANFQGIFQDALYLLGAGESDLWRFPILKI